ncbi:Phosphoglycerol transferase MdoB [Lachnospiraceae bacterium]|nr:Phosphoglycerol transferase MdoB [Lachnospiraceae bacterium]
MKVVTLNEEHKKIKNRIMFVVIPILIFYLSQLLVRRHSLEMSWKMQLVNIVLFEFIAFALFFLLGTARRALYTESVIFWFCAVLNSYIYSFRNSYIMPWDVASAGTAMNVAGNYDYTPTTRMVVFTLLFCLLWAGIYFCDLKAGKKIGFRTAGFVISVILFLGLGLSLQKNSVVKLLGIYTIQFDSRGMIKENGMLANFFYEFKYLKMEKPEGYSKKEIQDKLAEAEKEQDTVSGTEYPDIVVIMDEAFSDPAVDGKFTTNEDYMPFVHSLQNGAENTITGYMNVSVIGGNTPNTEFEFLTGNTMGFLPKGSIPFQQFVQRKMESMPWELKELGYQTIAMHPYKSNGWNRPAAYPRLGFDTIYFQEHFEDLEVENIRKYISDESFFDEIIAQVDKLGKNGPVFSFNVTMQNHSGYDTKYDNFPLDITVDGTEGSEEISAVRVNTYLSLMKKTDEAFEKLINHYKESDRPVIVVFFGDHQPESQVLDEIWQQNGIYWENISGQDRYNSYKVPFVIWANFDISEDSGIDTSANYLGNKVLKEAGIPLPGYRKEIEGFEKNYPVISAIQATDSEGNTFEIDDKLDEKSVLEYRKMQYFIMFDDRRN